MFATLLSLIANVIIGDLMWFDFDPIVTTMIQLVTFDLITDLMSSKFDFIGATLIQSQSNVVNPLELYVP